MTATFVHATLTRLIEKPGSGKDDTATYDPDPTGVFPVQFNPTSLKLSRTNNIDKGGSTTNTQNRQVPSVQPATLSFDLEFDTAEGDDDGAPKDVRELTRIVRQFTEPTKDLEGKPPPAVRFQWGKLIFDGIVTQLTEDLDYFSADGTPLRAKLSVTINEQNPQWAANALGAAARKPPRGRSGRPGSAAAGGPAAPATVPGTGPGSSPTQNPLSTALAKAGESVQQLLSRLNADPATWRSAMGGLGSPLSLQAGAQVQLGASASVSAGLGAGGGFTASAGVTDITQARAALGLGGTVSWSGGVNAEAGAGFALAEAGGLGRASASVQAQASGAAQADARAAFTVPEVRGGVRAQAGAELSADPRSLGYGHGIPLRARVSGDATATPTQ